MVTIDAKSLLIKIKGDSMRDSRKKQQGQGQQGQQDSNFDSGSQGGTSNQ